jgi:NAD+ synthase
MERLARHLSDWIGATIAASGGDGAVLGLSGGIDSAVVAALCTRAFPDHTTGVIMPCHSDPGDAEDGHLTAQHFGIAQTTVDLSPVFDLLCEQLHAVCGDVPGDRLTAANVKPRLRMTTLYAFANHLDYRVVGTGNRSEIAIGYFTKWGDGGVDLLPLGSLAKTRVRELARHLDVPQRIIDKPPSAGLWEGQSDESEMGITYEQLDAYLEGSGGTAAGATVDRLHAASRHKRELPPVAPLPPETGGGV